MRRALLCTVVFLLACSSKKDVQNPRDVPLTSPGRTVEQPAEQEPQVAERELPAPGAFGPVYFAYDDASIGPRAGDELGRLAEFLEKNSSASVLLEGHTDERGSPEYNIALGEQRARACRDYLVRLGVASHRLSTTSLGEERPAVNGSEEAAWAKNRRVELRVRR